ncbi:DNA topoisomerase 1 [Capsulimonas corticalis]|uniref:DNA topoisomerase 1 n=1 Tax=Capsulimonas corticalis TaxID=2219043 RepID=A0A402CQI9_9BACT|nr:type I DNA topoisomerase [Capsulimonas corticalis]BDI32635.1 DNA topoisomerase 1 [Capsulimonas corticalis]
MAKKLIIVESPAKTKTLKGFLGADYQVEASMGHVRDLPEKKLSIDIENDFAPTYVIIPERKDVVAKLKAAAKGADEVYLASDPDREGEAISWHLKEALGLKEPKRIQFNEITKTAVLAALQNYRTIDMDRVNAQQARRELDRIVGYKISPLLWRKVKKGLSAGRVQSVAVRLITDREREILAFNPVEYWTIGATLTPDTVKNKFDANLTERDNKKIEIPDQATSDKILSDLDGAEYRVKKVKKSEKRRNPSAPFITSTLQQEASRKLGFSAKRTMMVAQQLYEGLDVAGEGHVGLITYMRTDSTRIADEAQQSARAYIVTEYGAAYAPAQTKQYKKGGAAQDAHEAIRPTSIERVPDQIAKLLTAEQAKLYKLIWQRFLASQMAPAVFDVVTVDISARNYTFRATGSTVKFDGFLRVYREGKDDPNQVDDEDKQPLPALSDDQLLKLLQILPKQHFTEPPPRYTEATLVKALEEKGIGRPSTYAAIMSTIIDRKYVELEQKKFKPTELGTTVNDLLVKHFPSVLDIAFTAEMETKLDDVADGKEDWVAMMRSFYGPFAESLEKAGELMEKVKIEPKLAGIDCPNCGKPMVVRSSRFGEFVGCSDYPECKTIVRPEAEKIDVPCPKCGGEIVQKRSRKGAIFYGCKEYPKCDFVAWGKPTGEDCPTCGSPVVENTYRGRVIGVKCHNAECDYKESTKKPSEEAGENDEAETEPAPQRELATTAQGKG